MSFMINRVFRCIATCILSVCLSGFLLYWYTEWQALPQRMYYHVYTEIPLKKRPVGSIDIKKQKDGSYYIYCKKPIAKSALEKIQGVIYVDDWNIHECRSLQKRWQMDTGFLIILLVFLMTMIYNTLQNIIDSYRSFIIQLSRTGAPLCYTWPMLVNRYDWLLPVVFSFLISRKVFSGRYVLWLHLGMTVGILFLFFLLVDREQKRY